MTGTPNASSGAIPPDDAESAWVEPSHAEIAQNADLYEITYKEAARTLDDQTAEVSNARTRAVQFLAFVGSATAFLVGTAIDGIADKNELFYWVAGTGSVLALAGIGSVALLLSPWSTPLLKRVEPRLLIVNYIERDLPLPNKAEMWRELSLHFDKWQAANEIRLKTVRRLYFASIILGALQLLLWATLTWIAG
jgi:hypothetical protein